MRYIISLILTSTALPALADVPKVVTDLPPVHSLVAQVMGDLGQPGLLLEKGANGHSFQLRPSQAAEVAQADLVVWIGPEMTPWLDRALEGLSDQPQLRLLAAEGTHRQDFGATGPHDHGIGDHGHDDHAQDDHGHDDHGHDDHAHTGLDPHAWLDPANARHWLGLIADRLSAADPENAATYAANAAAAQAGIDALDAEVRASLAPLGGRPVVVFHDAYGYFAAHYGVNIAAAIAMGDAAAPGARHLEAVQEVLAQGPACLFPEANHDPRLVVQLAEATGTRLGAALDPEGAQIDMGPALYAQLMRELAQAMADCAAN